MSAYLRALGLAYKPAANEVPCDTCGGFGNRTVRNGFGDAYEMDCIDCGATGYVLAPEPSCKGCDGSVDHAGFCPACAEIVK